MVLKGCGKRLDRELNLVSIQHSAFLAESHHIRVTWLNKVPGTNRLSSSLICRMRVRCAYVCKNVSRNLERLERVYLINSQYQAYGCDLLARYVSDVVKSVP